MDNTTLSSLNSSQDSSLMWTIISDVASIVWDLLLRLNIWIIIFFFYLTAVHYVIPCIFWTLVLVTDTLFPNYNLCFPIKKFWSLTDTKGTRDRLARRLAKVKLGVWINPEDSDDETTYTPLPEEALLMTELNEYLANMVAL